MSNYLKLAFLFLTLFYTSVAFSFCSGGENTAIGYTAPLSEFTIHDNGSVTHNKTNLMWHRCVYGQVWDGKECSGDGIRFTWAEALQTAVESDAAGYDDWRLPNIKELISIFEYRCSGPSLNGIVFPTNPPFSGFWTSTPYAGGLTKQSYESWSVSTNGQATRNSRLSSISIRLVRNAN